MSRSCYMLYPFVILSGKYMQSNCVVQHPFCDIINNYRQLWSNVGSKQEEMQLKHSEGQSLSVLHGGAKHQSVE